MIDFRNSMMTAIYNRLSDLSVPVFTVPPDNQEDPYVYIGQINSSEIELKDNTRLLGVVNVIYYSGFNITTSLVSSYDILSDIKYKLKNDVNDVLSMSFWTNPVWNMENDTGLEQLTTDRTYTATLQYGFEIIQDDGFSKRVENDNGTIEAITCITQEYR